MGIKDPHDLALQDWMGSAQGSTATETHWPRRSAAAYVDFAAGEKRSWLRGDGPPGAYPVVGCGRARRRAGRGATATRCRASTLTWGTGPGVVAPPFERRVREAVARGLGSSCASATSVDELVVVRRRGRPACAARSSSPAPCARGEPSSRTAVGDFELDRAGRASSPRGGIGGNHELVRAQLAGAARHAADARWSAACPTHVDGRMLAHRAGRRRQRHQPRPHVALRRGHRATGTRSGRNHGDPHPPRALVAVVRRARAAGCRPRSSPASTRSGRSPTSWWLLHKGRVRPGS